MSDLSAPQPIRFNQRTLEKFQQLMPWRGSLPQFLNQCLEEFVSLQDEVSTPSALTKTVVDNVKSRHY